MNGALAPRSEQKKLFFLLVWEADFGPMYAVWGVVAEVCSAWRGFGWGVGGGRGREEPPNGNGEASDMFLLASIFIIVITLRSKPQTIGETFPHLECPLLPFCSVPFCGRLLMTIFISLGTYGVHDMHNAVVDCFLKKEYLDQKDHGTPV